jgi:hypothetical protein
MLYYGKRNKTVRLHPFQCLIVQMNFLPIRKENQHGFKEHLMYNFQC